METYKVIVSSLDTKWYNSKDKYHRINGPAIERTNGDKFWYKEGKLHREDGPAVELANGNKAWYLKNEYYSELEYNRKLNPYPYEEKIVEVEGRKYKLIGV